MPSLSTNRAALAAVTILALALLGAYVALTLAGHDASGLVQSVVTLLGVLGLGAHVEHRTRQQNATIEKIDRQTNGVLDGRIERGAARAVRQALREAGYSHLTDPEAPGVTPEAH